MLADGVLSANRCVQRVVTIARVSDWRQALLSVPRIIWGNVINFCAVAKATSLFIRTSYFGTKLVWAKTAHAFPSEAQLTGYKRKLGDLLLDERLVTLAQLNGALARQKENGGRLGDILVDMGSVPEPALLRTLGLQLRTDTIEIDAGTADPESAGLISEHAAREHLMLVVDSKARPVVVAAADVADARMKKWLDANLGCSYRLVLAGRRNLVDAIDRRLQSPPHAAAAPPRTLGDGTQERLQ
jgi:adsorption protein B